MSDEVLRITEGDFRFRFADPAQGLVQGAVLELGPDGALLGAKSPGGAGSYDSILDITIELRRTNLSRQFFAKVAGADDQGLRITWLTIDPGQPMRLRALMDAYRGRSGAGPTGKKTVTLDPGGGTGSHPALGSGGHPTLASGSGSGGHPTIGQSNSPTPSRGSAVVQPFGGGTITPFGAPPQPPPGAHGSSGTVPELPPTRFQIPSAKQPGDAVPRVGTRRLLRPSSTNLIPEGAPAEAPAGDGDEHEPHVLPGSPPVAGEDSRQHKVVIAPTAQFKSIGPESALQPTTGSTLRPTGRIPARPGTGRINRPVTGVVHKGDTERIEKVDKDDAGAFEGTQVRDSDGRLDIGATLRNKARTVRASELAARHDKVKVLNLATIRELITGAVEEAASHLTRALDEAEKKRLLEEAEEAFQEKLKAFQADKEDAAKKAQKLNDQLDHARRLLEEERKRTVSADQFTMSAAGLDEIEAAFRRIVDRAAVDGKVDGSLEEQLRKMAAHVLDDERQRIREKEMGAQNEKIELLEKKILRLANNLEDTERQRDEAREIAAALEKFAGQGMSLEQIKSKYQIGVSKDDPRRDQKLKLMKELLEQNRELRAMLGIATTPVEPGASSGTQVALAIPGEASGAQPVLDDPADTAVAPTDDGEAEAPTEPEINPDDQPWEPEAAEPEVNPDDLPWEPPTAVREDSAEVDERGVKKIKAVRDFVPPPLFKKP